VKSRNLNQFRSCDCRTTGAIAPTERPRTSVQTSAEPGFHVRNGLGWILGLARGLFIGLGRMLQRERKRPITLVIGAPGDAARLRGAIAGRGSGRLVVVPTISAARRMLVRDQGGITVLCIALDHALLVDRSRELRTLLADSSGFSDALRTIGLLPQRGLNPRLASVGCDVYVADAAQAADAMLLMQPRHRTSRQLRGRPRPHRLRSTFREVRTTWNLDSSRAGEELNSLLPLSSCGSARRLPAGALSRMLVSKPTHRAAKPGGQSHGPRGPD
jgi:hypothetical protein